MQMMKTEILMLKFPKCKDSGTDTFLKLRTDLHHLG